MLRQGANVKLAAELQVGAAGKIETESRNKTSLRRRAGWDHPRLRLDIAPTWPQRARHQGEHL